MMEGEGRIVTSEVTPSVMRTGGEGSGTMMLEERRPSQYLTARGCGGMADTTDLKSVAVWRAGSSPATRTKDYDPGLS